MDICLITPPSIFLLDERVFISLGILKVAAVLEAAGHRVEMLDLSGVENFEEAVATHMSDSRTRVYGITATTPQMPAVAKVVRVLRTNPNVRIILGGPHATLVHTAYKREQAAGYTGRAARAFAQLTAQFNTVVAGDGERAIFQAIEPFAPSVIDADDPKGKLFLTNQQLTELPLPARHLVDVKSYHYTIDGVPATSMIAQLGCPFECGFCGGRNSPSLRRLRTRPTESIIAEIKHLYDTYGFKGFMFLDDELNVNTQVVGLMNAITDLQMKLGVEFRLRGFVKSELFNPVQAKAMYSAGFRWLLTGFESGSPTILKNINKKATRDDNTRCMDTATAAGLKVKALMSIGHPGESAETIDDTQAWLLQVRPADFDLTIITAYPGSPYYDDAREHSKGIWTYRAPSGDALYQYDIDYNEVADYYKGDPDGGYKAYVYTDYLGPQSLVFARDAVEKTVRAQLNIPFYAGQPALRFEHSMGQGLPANIFRTTKQL
jgi:anaerobic magnesium-protoporphyrin IX monomethyl ester cyclase